MINQVYTVLWNKYRPVILQLMMASVNGAQQYKLSAHEFRALDSKAKGGYTFTLQAAHGKAVNNIRSIAVANDLLDVLRQSKKASELMNEATYEFRLDKQFVLHVDKKVEVLDKKEEVLEVK